MTHRVVADGIDNVFDYDLVRSGSSCGCGHPFAHHTSHGCLSCNCDVDRVGAWAVLELVGEGDDDDVDAVLQTEREHRRRALAGGAGTILTLGGLALLGWLDPGWSWVGAIVLFYAGGLLGYSLTNLHN